MLSNKYDARDNGGRVWPPSEFENQIWEHLVAWLICFAYLPSVVVSRSPGRAALRGSADLGQMETLLL